jgi:hypothetical protein
MTAVITVMVTMAATAWMKYAIAPVLAAYSVGRRVEAIRQRARRAK